MNSCTCKKLSDTLFLAHVVPTLTGECTWKSGKVTHHFFWKVLEAHSDYHKKLSTWNGEHCEIETRTINTFTPSDDCHESELGSTFNWKDSKKEQLIFPLWNRGDVAFHRSQLTIFQYEKPFAQAANWNLNCNLLGANCQSKYQHCVTILQSGAQMNNRSHCKNLKILFSSGWLVLLFYKIDMLRVAM